MVVTASRLDQQLTDMIAHTTVITQRISANRRPSTCPACCAAKRPGFIQNGGIGTATHLHPRRDERQVLILIDGVRVGSATQGTTPIENVMVEQVERVEIVRGNVSALYGADAIAGVIRIFTKQGRGEPRAEAQAMIGSRGTHRVSAGYGGSAGDTRFNLNVSQYQTNGFSAINPQQAPRANPDDDGYHNLSVSGQLAHRLVAGHEIGLRVFQSAGKVQFDNASGTPTERNNSDNTLFSVALYSNNQLTSFWKSHFAIARGATESRTFTNGGTPTRFNTANAQYQWQNDFNIAKEHVVTASLEGQEQRVDSTTVYRRTGRDVRSMMLAYSGRVGAHQLQGSTRRDHYSDFGDANTWLAGYGYDINPL